MIQQLRSKSSTSQDSRTFREVIERYPKVRELLYTSERLMKEAAKGAMEHPKPWHVQLLRLTTRRWEPKESVSIIELILGFLNDDYPPKEKEAGDGATTI